MPALRHSQLYESDKYNVKKKQFNMHYARIQEDEDVVLTDIVGDENRQKKCVLLRFSSVCLSNQPFSPDSERGEVDIDMIYIETNWEIDEGKGLKTKTMTEAVVHWKLAILEPKPRALAKKAVASNKALEKLTQRIQGMNVNP